MTQQGDHECRLDAWQLELHGSKCSQLRDPATELAKIRYQSHFVFCSKPYQVHDAEMYFVPKEQIEVPAEGLKSTSCIVLQANLDSERLLPIFVDYLKLHDMSHSNAMTCQLQSLSLSCILLSAT